MTSGGGDARAPDAPGASGGTAGNAANRKAAGNREDEATVDGVLLTRRALDGPDGLQFELWLATSGGPVRVLVDRAEAVAFVRRSDRDRVAALLQAALRAAPGPAAPWRLADVDLDTLAGEPVAALYCRERAAWHTARERLHAAGIRLFEDDVGAVDRHLMERGIRLGVRVERAQRDAAGTVRGRLRAIPTPAAALTVLSLDIETSWVEHTLYSIGACTADVERVFMIAPPDPPAVPGIAWCADERAVITQFLAWLQAVDPDVLVGWNVVGFDLDFLQRRCDALGLRFELGRQRSAVAWSRGAGRPGEAGGAAARERGRCLVPGRAVIDGIEALRTAGHAFDSFALDFVATRLLGRGKLIDHTKVEVEDRAEGIRTLFRTDRRALAAYNIEDCRLVLEIFAHERLLAFCLARSALTGLALGRAGGSVAAFDYLYLPRLHRAGYVAAAVRDVGVAGGSPGGFVLDSVPGIHRNVLLFDFKSLYPSIIRTFAIDPLALQRGLALPPEQCVPGFDGARFAADAALLGTIIGELWAARDAARGAGDRALTQAIKIIMNSFYGVLGTAGCRFFDARLVSSITRRGHAILRRTREMFTARGHAVIYGDTDSLFVRVADAAAPDVLIARAGDLARAINAEWAAALRAEHGIDSHLELQFEALFERFLMPSVRGSSAGSKKRYAGLRCGADGHRELVFKGLEAVRSDWTELARDVQRELYRRIFHDEPWQQWLRGVVDELRAGRHDDRLVLRKRLRQDLDDYRGHAPPHVQAARLDDALRRDRGLPGLHRRGGRIEYVLTDRGPEPARRAQGRLDHAAYIERQIRPVADAILAFCGADFDSVIGGQAQLFPDDAGPR